MIKRLFILCAPLIFIACGTPPKLDTQVAIEGTYLPKIGSGFGAYKHVADGRILVQSSNNSWTYRYGTCDIKTDAVQMVRYCEENYGGTCKVIGLGENDVRKLNDTELEAAMTAYQTKVADEQSKHATPSSIFKLNLVTYAISADQTKDGLSSGQVSADRHTPCAGHFEIKTSTLGICTGVWKNVNSIYGDAAKGDSAILNELDLSAACDSGEVLLGKGYIHDISRGLALLKTEAGDKVYAVIGETSGAHTSAASFAKKWVLLKNRKALALTGDQLPNTVDIK